MIRRLYLNAMEIIGNNNSPLLNANINDGANDDIRARKIGDQSTVEFHKTPTRQKTCLGQNED